MEVQTDSNAMDVCARNQIIKCSGSARTTTKYICTKMHSPTCITTHYHAHLPTDDSASSLHNVTAATRECDRPPSGAPYVLVAPLQLSSRHPMLVASGAHPATRTQSSPARAVVNASTHMHAFTIVVCPCVSICCVHDLT